MFVAAADLAKHNLLIVHSINVKLHVVHGMNDKPDIYYPFLFFPLPSVRTASICLLYSLWF